MKPYDQTLGLEKICSIFLCNPNNFIFFVWYEREKKQLFKKIHNVICSLVWLWERSNTLNMWSCMVMGEDHHIVMHIFENKYGGNEPFKGRSNREPR
jgi:hypothetical protein